MKLLRTPRLLVASALALLVALAPLPASAAPLEVERDRTDNGYSFSYDAANGEITQAASSIRFDSRDRVSFVIYVRDNTKSDVVGERLRAQLSLALNKDRTVLYDGSFTLEISDASGVVHSQARSKRIVLRPKRGHRRSRLCLVFDLPSGSYSARALFARDSG